MFSFSLFINLVAISAAYAAKKLTHSGAIAALVVGTLFMYLGGFVSWLLLIMLLVSSTIIETGSLLFRLKSPNRRSSPSEETHGRSAFQVLANSLLALGCLLLYWNNHEITFYYLMVIAIAGSTADTWASEIGILSQRMPISILTGKKMPPGKSGGVTRLGLVASFLGAGFISLLAVLFSPQVTLYQFIPLMILGGLCSLIDSLLGLTVQEIYKDSETGLEYEELPKDFDSTRYVRIKGLPGIDNSAVNFLSDLLTLMISWSFFSLF